MFNKLLLLFLLISAYSGYTQKLDAVRLEVPSDINVEQFHVETLNDKGMLIFYESKEVNKEKLRKWYFGLFDIDLKQLWLKFVPLSDKIEFISSQNKNGNLYFLFKNINRERFEYGFYEIVTYNIKKQSFSRITGSIPLKSEIAGFDIIGNTACIALNLKKHETDLVFVNLNNGDVQPIHVDEGVPGYIEALHADEESNIFYVALKQNKDRRYISDQIISFSPNGRKLSEIMVQGTEALKYFREYIFVPQKNNNVLIFGTYDIITGRTLSFKDIEEEREAKSAGMFFLKIKDGKQKSLYYYDFMGFNNIMGAISPSNISTVKMQTDSLQSEHGKQLVSASFHLSEPIVFKSTNDIYLFSVEAYRPYYRTETRMDYDFYGRPYPYTYNVFSGYKFYDVIIAGISPEGKLLWNNDFEIDNILTYSTRRNSVVFEDENYTTIAYVNDGYVVSQTIEGPIDLNRSKMKIGTDFPQDRVSQDENNHIMHWYKDYFLIYGYQKLKNRTLGNQATRIVFYANKITYQ
ncbi:MAG TPA: hypothetical protein QF480_06995 [Bacteroidales bacterium]|jgi:hypothetical protein|nr:hypothetical protein [Bacteroidota bacterium]HJN06346.1 hypothetical protein [Bacteroidales bacterium]|tara:strand:+ start:413 stop:1972 length:1560 start_codon:yes stop_codon:yes gene_type:complete